MAFPRHFIPTCWKNLKGDRLNNQLFFIVRALHKSAASKAFGISAAGEEAIPERLITPADVGEKTRIKTLQEMPGPSTLSNLIEFFWKDGFGRIHEIQVMMSVLVLCPKFESRIKICIYAWQESVYSQHQSNLPLTRKMAQAVA